MLHPQNFDREAVELIRQLLDDVGELQQIQGVKPITVDVIGGIPIVSIDESGLASAGGGGGTGGTIGGDVTYQVPIVDTVTIDTSGDLVVGESLLQISLIGGELLVETIDQGLTVYPLGAGSITTGVEVGFSGARVYRVTDLTKDANNSTSKYEYPATFPVIDYDTDGYISTVATSPGIGSRTLFTAKAAGWYGVGATVYYRMVTTGTGALQTSIYRNATNILGLYASSAPTVARKGVSYSATYVFDRHDLYEEVHLNAGDTLEVAFAYDGNIGLTSDNNGFYLLGQTSLSRDPSGVSGPAPMFPIVNLAYGTSHGILDAGHFSSFWIQKLESPAGGGGGGTGGGGISYTDEQAQDAAAALFAAGTHSGITFTYDDAANSLSATVTGGGTYTDEQAQDAAAAMIAAGTHSGITFSYNDAANSLSATVTAGGTGTVTSVQVSGGTTGLTFSGGPITTSGTLTMAGTLALASGGTGATTAGAARTNLGLGTAATRDDAYFLTPSQASAAYQPLDGDLTALAALAGTNTIYYRSGVSTWTAVTIGFGLSFSGGTLTATGGPSYTDEQAQDAVGAMLDNLSLLYNDATPLLSVKRQQSITADPNGLLLVNDVPAPGINKVYGTDAAGNRGWQTPAGGGTVTSFSAGDCSPLFTTTEATATTTPALSFALISQAANTLLAGPASGAAANPTFRSLVQADLGLTTKGDILVSSGVLARLGVGTNGQVLTADSTFATGLKWATPAGGSVFLPAGPTHAPGIVPDPGATAHPNQPYVLSDAATWIKQTGAVIAYSNSKPEQSTTGTSPRDLPTVQSVTVTIDEAMTVLFLIFSETRNFLQGAVNSLAGAIDGAVVLSTDYEMFGANKVVQMSGMAAVALTAGTHTFKLQFGTNAGTAFYRNRAFLVLRAA